MVPTTSRWQSFRETSADLMGGRRHTPGRDHSGSGSREAVHGLSMADEFRGWRANCAGKRCGGSARLGASPPSDTIKTRPLETNLLVADVQPGRQRHLFRDDWDTRVEAAVWWQVYPDRFYRSPAQHTKEAACPL